jgi:hypothetical protein
MGDAVRRVYHSEPCCDPGTFLVSNFQFGEQSIERFGPNPVWNKTAAASVSEKDKEVKFG